MKFRVVRLFVIGALLVLLSACANFGGEIAEENRRDIPENQSTEKLLVIASFYPMYDFAEKIGGDRIDLYCMVPNGSEPHDWEPTPNDMARLEKADVFIYNGRGMEHWVEKIQQILVDKDIRIIEASKGIECKEGNQDERDQGEAEAGGTDPHVWLNPMNAKHEINQIKEALSEADPLNADYYDANFSKWAAEIDILDEELSAAVASMSNKSIVVQHEAYGYLCDRYSLTQIAVQGLGDEEPQLGRIAGVIDFIKENDVRVIYFEELTSSKVTEMIAEETNVDFAVLNPLEGLTEEQMAAGKDYFSIMRENMEALKKS